MTDSESTRSGLKDVAITNDIMQMSEMGFFDLLLTAYGTAYVENDGISYLVSANNNILCEYMMALREKGFTPTSVISRQRFIPNLAGTEENEQAQLEYDIGCEMAQLIVPEDLKHIATLAQAENNQQGESLFSEWQEQLEGYFYYPDLQLFSITLTDTYIAKKISTEFYQQIKEWTKQQINQISDEVLLPGKGKKTFWGFAHWKPGKQAVKFMIDGNRAAIINQWEKIRSSGSITSPLYQETLSLKHGHTPLELRTPFLESLKKQLNADYIARLNHIRSLPPSVDVIHYKTIESQLKSDYALQTLSLYKNWWGL